MQKKANYFLNYYFLDIMVEKMTGHIPQKMYRLHSVKKISFGAHFRKKCDRAAVTFLSECAIKSIFWSECDRYIFGGM